MIEDKDLDDKWEYIKLISALDDSPKLYGNTLIALMDYYGVNNTASITLEQARDFYNKIKR